MASRPQNPSPKGVTPLRLVAQMENTAAWALTESPIREVVAGAASLESRFDQDDALRDYFQLLVTAHFTTVATFVPTDVDSQIRHHVWLRARSEAHVRELVEVLREIESWDPRLVSARVIETKDGLVSGHHGEWFSIRAGALGRALGLDATALADELADELVTELRRELRAYQAAREANPIDALRIATTIAHNAGDLNRVAAAWSAPNARASRYFNLFTDPASVEPALAPVLMEVANVNTTMMANENHRFLPLREVRALRAGRTLLLPLGPFFDAWGEAVVTSTLIDRKGVEEFVQTLLEAHARAPTQQGYLRALCGVHQARGGGLDRIASNLPSKARKLSTAGSIREALRIDEERFCARLVKRYRELIR